MKLVNCLDNRGISLKERILKVSSQKGGLLNFLGLLVKTGLPSMKNVLLALAKSVLVP